MERPNIVDVLEKLQEIATRLGINPESPIDLPLRRGDHNDHRYPYVCFQLDDD